ncbi:MAG: hypothetical protein GXO18_03670 [Aquificae bacterium]|nr:hypothetical protein [Aquificota bacterium]
MNLENNKEKREQAESVQKEQKQSYIREVFKLIDEAPLGKIFLVALMYGFGVFIIPYFIHYRFIPIDLTISSIPIKFIILVITTAISFGLSISFLILGLVMLFSTLREFNEEDKNFKKDNNHERINIHESLYLILYLIFFVIAWAIIILTENPKPRFLLFLFIIPIIDIVLTVLTLALTNKIHSINFYAHKHYTKLNSLCCKLIKLFYTSIIRWLAFIIFFGGSIFVLIIFFRDTKSYTNIYFALAFIALITFLIFTIIYLIGRKDTIATIITVVFTIYLIPILFLSFEWKSYINFLEPAYSLVGVFSDKNIVCVNKNYSFAMPCCYKQIDINEDMSVIIHKNTNEQYICYKDLKIIWNGDSSIWIASNQNRDNKYQPIISIPKKYLLNNDIINYGYKTTPKIKQIQKSQIQTQGDGTQNINPQSKKANTEKLNYKE